MTRNLTIVCVVRKLQKNFFADCEVPSLLPCEVLFDELATGTSKVVEGISDVLTNVDLPVGVGNLINNLHEQSARLSQLRSSRSLGIDDIFIEGISTFEPRHVHDFGNGVLLGCIEFFGAGQVSWLYFLNCLWSAASSATCACCF